MKQPSTLRSLLFSPASNARMLAKAKLSEADAFIFDLEDSVEASTLEQARSNACDALEQVDRPAFVRVNNWASGEMIRDIAAVMSPNLYGVVLPKVDDEIDIVRLDTVLAIHEEVHGIATGTTLILPLVESCVGLNNLPAIARSSDRVCGLAFSSGEEGDFIVDLDGRWTPSGEAMMYPRSKLVCDTRAAGLKWPVDGVSMKLNDEGALMRECELARTLGFGAKMAVHPGQIEAIHQAFTPSDEDVARSQQLVQSYALAGARGQGAVRLNDQMVDKANLRRAELILERASQLQDQHKRR